MYVKRNTKVSLVCIYTEEKDMYEYTSSEHLSVQIVSIQRVNKRMPILKMALEAPA